MFKAQSVGPSAQRRPEGPRVEAVGDQGLVVALRGLDPDAGAPHPGGGSLHRHFRAD